MAAEAVDFPQVVRARDLLVVPAGTDVLRLARAWYPDAVRTRRPGAATAPPPQLGARFRGVPAGAAPAQSGVVRLDALTELHGPRTLTAAEAVMAGYRASGAVDVYAVSSSDGSSAGAWLVAAARHAGGLVAPGDGSAAVVPDPAAVVDVALWSAVPLSVHEAVAAVRPALAGGRVGDVRVGHVVAGPPPFDVPVDFPYDGALTIEMSRPAAGPPVLGSLDWREHGPWQYRVAWESPHEDPALEPASPLTVIARGRIRPTVARIALALRGLAGGTVVDADGFVVSPEDLLARASRR